MKKKIRTFFRVRRLYYSRLKLRQAANQHLVTGFFFQSLMADPMGCSGGPSEAHRRFCGGGEGLRCWLITSSSTKKTPRSLLAAYDDCFWSGAPDALKRPIRSAPQFRLLWLLTGSSLLSASQVQKRSVGGAWVLSHFVVLRISRTNFDHSSNHTVEMGVSLETSVAGSLESTTSCCELTPS